MAWDQKEKLGGKLHYISKSIRAERERIAAEAKAREEAAKKAPPVNYTEAQEANMPALTGSEKQVKWAEDIRESVLREADRLVEDAARGQSGEWWRMSGSDDRAVSLQSAFAARQDAINTLSGVTSAKQIIDLRQRLQGFVTRAAKERDRQSGTSFKRSAKDAKLTDANKAGVYAKPKKK